MNDVTRILSAIEQGDEQAPVSSCRWSTTSCASSPRGGSPARPPARRSRPRGWCTRRTSAWSTVEPDRAWNGRGHFFAAAAEAMRRILVENARRKRRLKHGGARRRVELDEAALAVDGPPADELLAVDEALERLAAEDPQAAELVKLHYFAGLTVEQAAELLGVSATKSAIGSGLTPGPGCSDPWVARTRTGAEPRNPPSRWQ